MNNFLIVGTQRTGSSALGNGIGLHPNVTCGWEWTLRVAPWRAISIAEAGLAKKFNSLTQADQDHMAKSDASNSATLGFRKLFRSSNKWIVHPKYSPALLLDRLEAHINWLRKSSQIKIIHILREDNLGWLTSKALSKESGLYFGEPYADDLAVRVDIREAVKRVIAKDWVDSRLASLRQSNPYMLIRYEEFRNNNAEAVSRALRFLGEDPVVTPPIEKHMKAKPQSRKDVRESVTNFAELEAALSVRGLLRSTMS